jgi:hypothetical protein
VLLFNVSSVLMFFYVFVYIIMSADEDPALPTSDPTTLDWSTSYQRSKKKCDSLREILVMTSMPNSLSSRSLQSLTFSPTAAATADDDDSFWV